jgi:hypothetical protein
MTSTSPVAGGLYGRSVHTYGDFVIVGDNSTQGGASIYIMPGHEWVEQARLQRPNGEIGSFGHSCGLEASLAVVSAPQLFQIGGDFNFTNPLLNNSANVYLYGRDMNSWSLQAKVSSLQPGADGFGYSVALGGSYLVVGAPYAYGLQHGDGIGFGVHMFGAVSSPSSTHSPNPIPNPSSPTSHVQKSTGAVYTYKKIDDIWTATGVLVPFVADEDDLFGWSVDISPDGTRLVVGSPGDVTDGIASGSTYVYYIDAALDGTWSLETVLMASDEEPFDNFGYSVGVDVSDVIVGTKTARAAYIFHKMADSWVQEAKLVGSDTQLNDGFGQSVAIFGTYAIVGSPLNMARGAAYLWELDMLVGSWVQLRKFTASLPGARLGGCVSIGARFMLSGAPSANHDIGHVLSLMLDSTPTTGNSPVVDAIHDVLVLIRFSGSSSTIDLLITRKIIAEAAGTGTAQTEVRIVDLTTNNGPITSHLFGLQIRFTSSPTMSAGNAAQNLIAALPDIRYRLNAAVGAISGTAEVLASEPPIEAESKITIQQVAAVIILVLITIFTTVLTVYYTLQRRKRIAADQKEFDAQEAEREAKRQEVATKKEKTDKKPRTKRQSTVLRGQKRKDRSFLQAENDAAGLEFTDTFFEQEDFPLSPRAGGLYDDPGTVRLDYDPTESIENLGGSAESGIGAVPLGHHDDDHHHHHHHSYAGMDMDGPRIALDLENDGPSLMLDDGPRIALDLDDGPKIRLGDGPRIAIDMDMNDGPKLTMNDGPRIALDDGPSLRLDDGPRIDMMMMGSGKSNLGVKTQPSDGPKIDFDMDNHNVSISTPTKLSSNNDGLSTPKMNDGEMPSVVSPLSLSGVVQYDSGNDSDSGISTPSKRTRPAGIPRLNLNLGGK